MLVTNISPNSLYHTFQEGKKIIKTDLFAVCFFLINLITKSVGLLGTHMVKNIHF